MNPTRHSLWMGDLEPWMDEDFIIHAFQQMGESVLGVKIINNKPSGRAPAGYCFVEFPTEDEGRKAMLRLSGKVIPGSKPPKLFKLNLASFGREHLNEQEYSLFIGDLTEEVDDLKLYTTFEGKYKSVKMAKVVIDPSGTSRGYGFVRFGEEREMKNALIHMQRYPHLGRKPIKVSLATPKSKRNLTTYNPTETTGTTTTSSSTHNYSSYYNQQTQQQQQQQQPDYSQYYQNQAWWQAYQMPGNYYGYGEYSYDDQQAAAPVQEPEEEEEEMEDPELEIDVAKSNEAFMEKSEELYTALEDSRWQPIDNIMSPPTTSVKS